MALSSLPTRRNRIFNFAETTSPSYWLRGDAFLSRLFDALSTLLPLGERFFVDSIKPFQARIDDPALGEAVEAFVYQEAMHGREHRRYNQGLRESGHHTPAMDSAQARLIRLYLSFRDKRVPLALTVANEHLTAILAEEALGGDFLEGCQPEMLELWRWHSAEEIEHKAVAFDVYRAVGGGYPLRALAMVYATLQVSGLVLARTAFMLKEDQALSKAQVWQSALYQAVGKKGLVRRISQRYVEFYRPSFHPWDRDNQHLVTAWENAQSVQATPALEPRFRPQKNAKILFDVIEEFGEQMTIEGGLVNTKTGESLGEFVKPHRDYDAYSSAVSFLASSGVEFKAPGVKEQLRKPTVRRRLRALRTLRMNNPGVRWKATGAWKRGQKVTDTARAVKCLSLEQSASIRASAKAAGVTTNTYLLHCLHMAVAPKVAEVTESAGWGMPVNMRGADVPENVDNGSSMINVAIHNGDSPTDVQESVKQALREEQHWGQWDSLNWAIGLLGRWGARRAMNDYYDYKSADPGRLGVFSNAGRWQGNTPPEVALYGYGPPSAVDRIFACAVSWNDRLSVSLRVHPIVTDSEAEVQGWVDAWTERLVGLKS